MATILVDATFSRWHRIEYTEVRHMEEERVWIQRSLAGDQRAFAQLVDAYKSPVFNLAYRLLGDAAEAEDAAQETFVRVYTRLETYDAEKKFVSWILSIASHYCIDRLRRRRSSSVSLDQLLTQRAFSDPHEGPERTTLRQEEQAYLQRMLQELPDAYRLVLVLRYWHDLSYQEMSQVLETTESAIKSRLHRARCILAERIRKQEQQSSSEATPASDQDGASQPHPHFHLEAAQYAMPRSN